jgi:two-component system, OmpR family, sensor histidine kinase PhoQ
VHSLSRRLLISVSVPLALFFGVMMYVLDNGFQRESDRTLQELLDSQMVALVAAAEPMPGGGYAPPVHDIDPRLARPRSGIFAQIRSAKHQWRSPSTAGTNLDFGPLLSQGDRSFFYTEIGRERIAVESRGLQFEDDEQNVRSLTFSVAVSLSPYQQQLLRFRQKMLGSFSAAMFALLLTLAALLHWVLSPVRRLEREIHEVEEGRVDVLGSGYPRELSGVATNLNALLVGERKRVQRYRDTMGNLAHGLKTPLAVMQTTLSKSGESPANVAAFGVEIDRMRDIIAHQLKRAAASGGALLGQAPVDVAGVATDLRSALLKVYASKDLSIELAIERESQFIGDRGDFTELLGNLVDNACKFCRSRVRVTVAVDSEAGARERLMLCIDDDGPGISEENRSRVLQRGVRTDESVPGQGLGLAMVHDTVDLYGGSLSIDTSPLGGARFELRLPGR